MPVQLKDAKITVKIDLEESKKEVKSLEKKTTEQRQEKEKEDRKEKERARRAKGGRRRTRGSLGRYAGGGIIAGTVQKLTTAGLGIPGVEIVFMAAVVGAALAELNERFGPMAGAILDELLPSKVAALVPTGSMNEFAREWAVMKAKLASLEAGFSQATGMAAAIAITGGQVTPDMFAEIFGEERKMAMHLILQEKYKRFITQRLVGGAIGGAVNDATKQLRDGIDKRVEDRLAENARSEQSR